jgi:hypothetical protein
MRNGKLIIVATLVLSASVAFADKLSDFEDAAAAVDANPAGKGGCKTIPPGASRAMHARARAGSPMDA